MKPPAADTTLEDVHKSVLFLQFQVNQALGKLDAIQEILKARDRIGEIGEQNTKALAISLFDASEEPEQGTKPLFSQRAAAPRPVTAEDPIKDEDVPI